MKKLTVTLFCLALSTATFANHQELRFGDKSPNGCKHLNVQIVNNTGNPCSLSSQIIHGKLAHSSSLATAVKASDSASFTLQEIDHAGPIVSVEANCGPGRSVTFTAEQPYCGGVWSTPAKGSVLSSTNVKANQISTVGSALHSRPGIITWVLS